MLDLFWIFLLIFSLFAYRIWSTAFRNYTATKKYSLLFFPVVGTCGALAALYSIDISNGQGEGFPWVAAYLGFPAQQVVMGNTINLENDFNDASGAARYWWRRAAKLGSIDGQLAIAHYWLDGPSGEDTEFSLEAFRWLEAAANRNDWRAEMDMGCIYRTGLRKGIEIIANEVRAKYWFERANRHRLAVDSGSDWRITAICRISDRINK